MAEIPVHKIKKYPNRRFYDLTRSRHITFEELFELVRGGGVIQVTDSASGEDITSAVLTHMILERDAPKLTMFSSDLLHQVIQSNQQIINSFVDRYFNRALQAFLASQQQFDGFLKNAGISPPPMLDPRQWARAFMGGQPLSDGAEPQNATESPPPPERDSSAALGQLQTQIQELSRRLQELDRGSARPSRRPAKRARSAPRGRRKPQ